MRLILLALIIVSVGCGGTPEPCEYDILHFSAKITDISEYQEEGESYFHVEMQFDISKLADEKQYLEDLKGIKIDRAFLDRTHIQKGYIYKGTISELIKGNCEEQYLTFDHKFE